METSIPLENQAVPAIEPEKSGGFKFSLKWLLIFVPIAAGLNHHAAAPVVFFTACLAIIPLASLMGEGTEVSVSGSPEQFKAFLVEDGKFWVNLVKSANVKVE